jgi:hypothetical protein
MLISLANMLCNIGQDTNIVGQYVTPFQPRCLYCGPIWYAIPAEMFILLANVSLYNWPIHYTISAETPISLAKTLCNIGQYAMNINGPMWSISPLGHSGLIPLANTFTILGHLDYKSFGQGIQYDPRPRLAGALETDKCTTSFLRY